MKPIGPWPGLVGLLCLLAAPALATDIATSTATGAERAPIDGQLESLPPDVAAVAARERQCRGWLATEITDQATDYRVEQALLRLRCDALASDLVVLRHKYAQSPQDLRALDTAGDLGP